MADDEVTSEVTDVLGEPWLARTIPLRPDRVTARTGIPPVATLVRRDEPPRRRAVLYVHGFVDYFFGATPRRPSRRTRPGAASSRLGLEPSASGRCRA